MTVILKSICVGDLVIQNYWQKFSAASFWRVIKSGRTIRAGLLNKPNREQITNYLYNY